MFGAVVEWCLIILSCAAGGGQELLAAAFFIAGAALLCRALSACDGTPGLSSSAASSRVLPHPPLASNMQDCKRAPSILGAGGFSGMNALPVLHDYDSSSLG